MVSSFALLEWTSYNVTYVYAAMNIPIHVFWCMCTCVCISTKEWN